MRLRIDRWNSASGVADADDERSLATSRQASGRRSRRHSPVDISPRRNRRPARSRRPAAPRAPRRDKNVPDAAFQRIARRPDTELQRPALPDDDGQRDPAAALDHPYRPVAKVRLAAKRPVGADDPAADLADRQVERRGNPFRPGFPLVDVDEQAFIDQALALRLSPPCDVGPSRLVAAGISAPKSGPSSCMKQGGDAYSIGST